MHSFTNRAWVMVVLSAFCVVACGPKTPPVAYRAPVKDIAPPRPVHVAKAAAPAYAPAYKPAPAPVPARTLAPSPVAVKAPPPPPPAKTVVLPKGAIAWEWPSSGKIIANFSTQNAQKGIDIAGRNGQSVITAAPGVVVYSGNGLRGYGQMVIIKHNDQFLSAYAHNSRVFVKEGDVVKAQSKIAEMGQTDTESVRLHFEIRKNGQPVDPMLYLPKRG